jgi:cyclic pyranopterin phosphate synthase
MAESKGMIDISGKNISVRTAKACASVILGQEAFNVLEQGSCIKGDVLATAKVAAVQAVKSTAIIIPMCHPLFIEAIDVEFKLNEPDKSVVASVTVKSSGKTGVEMEALCGATAACLTVYDMLKYTGKTMTISQVKLLEKTGGKSGDYKRPN